MGKGKASRNKSVEDGGKVDIISAGTTRSCNALGGFSLSKRSRINGGDGVKIFGPSRGPWRRLPVLSEPGRDHPRTFIL